MVLDASDQVLQISIDAASHLHVPGCDNCLVLACCCPHTTRQMACRENNGMYPQGYVTPVSIDVLAQRSNATTSGLQVPKHKFGDPELQLSHEQMAARGRLVKSGDFNPSVAGCNGLSVVVEHLDYVDYRNIFVLPAFHGLLYGLGMGFLNLIFAPVSCRLCKLCLPPAYL